MRLETGNRAFLALVVVAIGAGLAIVLAACASVGLIAFGAVVGTTGVTITDVLPALVFLLLVAAGVAAGVWSMWRQLRATNVLARRVASAAVPVAPDVVRAAARTGLGGRVDVVGTEGEFSFAYGLIGPRVVVSHGLASSASPDELEAVLTHERYHVANLDPLKVVAARGLSSALFFLPVLRDFQRRYVAGRELAADRRAVEAHGRRPLASALYRVVAGPDWPELATAAAMGAPELLDARVSQLESGREPELSPVSRRAIVLTLAAAGVLVWALVASMLAMSRLMPSMMASNESSGMDGMSVAGVAWMGLLVLILGGITGALIRGLRARGSH